MVKSVDLNRMCNQNQNINRSPILNKILVRAPILYQSMNLMVNVIDESADVVAWILEEAVRKRQYSINQMNDPNQS